MEIPGASHQPLAADKPAAVGEEQQFPGALVDVRDDGEVLSGIRASLEQEVVKTDVPQGMLGYFANLAGKTRDLSEGSVELVPDNGVDPQNPDYDYIRSPTATALT